MMCNERLFKFKFFRKLSFLCSINGENRSHSCAENVFSILNYLTTIDWRWNVTFINFAGGGLVHVHCSLPIYESLCNKYQLDLSSDFLMLFIVLCFSIEFVNRHTNWFIFPMFIARCLFFSFLMNAFA